MAESEKVRLRTSIHSGLVLWDQLGKEIATLKPEAEIDRSVWEEWLSRNQDTPMYKLGHVMVLVEKKDDAV